MSRLQSPELLMPFSGVGAARAPRMIGSLVACCAVFAASHAMANGLQFSQFGPPGTTLPDPVTGYYIHDKIYSDTFTVTGPGAGFEVEGFYNRGGHWYDPAGYNLPLLYDNGAPGALTLSFDVPTGGLLHYGVGFYFEDYLPGSFSATATAYDGAVVVATETLTSIAGPAPTDFVDFSLSGKGLPITSVVVTSTNDSHGWAIGGFAAPEPSTWTMLLVGFAGLGATLRGRRRAPLRAAHLKIW